MDERQRRIREEFIDGAGTGTAFWDGLLQLDPDFFEAYLQLLGRAVEERDAGAEVQGARLHRDRCVDDASLRAGPAPAHPERASARGDEGRDHGGLRAHRACSESTPARSASRRCSTSSSRPGADGRWRRADGSEQERMKQDFVDRRGYWNEFWDGLLALDPDFFQAYLSSRGCRGRTARSSRRSRSSSTLRSMPRRRTSTSRACASTSRTRFGTARRRRRSWRSTSSSACSGSTPARSASRCCSRRSRRRRRPAAR